MFFCLSVSRRQEGRGSAARWQRTQRVPLVTEQLQFGTVLDELIEKTLRSLLATDLEKAVLGVLRMHRGSQNAIKSARIAEQLEMPHGETSRRNIAGAIENLVELHHIQVGGLRVPPYGYFLIET